MIVRDTKNVYRREVERAIGKDATAKDVLDYLFGDVNSERKTNFVIKEWEVDTTTKPIHRLNMFWAVPLTLLCAPVQYVLYGHVGWTTKTKFGRWIIRVTGHLKET